MITTTHYMVLSAALFTLGVIGVLTRRNIIIVFMSIELMLNAVNINLVAFSHQLQNAVGQVFARLRHRRRRGRGRRRPRHHPRVLPQQGNRQHRRDEPAAVVSGMDLIWLIPLLPGLGAARQRPRRRPLLQQAHVRPGGQRGDGRGPGARALRVLAAARAARGRARAHRARRCVDPVDPAGALGRHRRQLRRPLGLPPRSAVRDDDPRRHRRRVPDPRLLDRLHARGVEGRLRAVLRVPEPLRLLHADARARRQLPRDVRRVGGRRPLLVPADRVLLREEERVGRRQEGVHRQPDRRLGLHRRDVPASSPPSGPSTSGPWPTPPAPCPSRPPGSARSRSSRCCCSSAPRGSPRRSRCTSGCRTPWRARPRSPP